MLGASRPELMTDDLPPFFLEKVVARKVILPATLVGPPAISQLAIWVSDPNPHSLRPEDSSYDFPGSFLFLTEMHLDNGGFQTVYSGCSALQAIANAANDRSLLDRSKSAGEPLGRGNYDHPLKKLVSLGGTLGDAREIECLYRVRYMTNEQCFGSNGVEYRLNDILGYPIYIAQAL